MLLSKTVYLMLSGGVDSSVSAYILKQLGYKVVGIYMLKWWRPDLGPNCPANEDLEYVFKVSRQLNIPVYVADFRDIYQQKVLKTILDEFKKGVTPNPDTLCNRHIKFGQFFDYIKKTFKTNNFLVATGHYAFTYNMLDLADDSRKNKMYLPIDSFKDQTYFLYDINPSVVGQVIFPLAFLTKPMVRDLAKELGLATAKRQDSTGVCFIGNIELSEFLKKELGNKPGNIVDIETGKIVKQHNGLWFYTIGQRKGLGIGGVSPAYYVVKKDYANNVLYVAKGRYNRYIFSKKIEVINVNMLTYQEKTRASADSKLVFNDIAGVIRYRSYPYLVDAEIHADVGLVKHKKTVFYSEKMANQKQDQGFWAVASGQSVVLYSKVFDKPDYNNVQEYYSELLKKPVDVNNVTDLYSKYAEKIVEFLAKNNRDVYMLGGGIIK